MHNSHLHLEARRRNLNSGRELLVLPSAQKTKFITRLDEIGIIDALYIHSVDIPKISGPFGHASECCGTDVSSIEQLTLHLTVNMSTEHEVLFDSISFLSIGFSVWLVRLHLRINVNNENNRECGLDHGG